MPAVIESPAVLAATVETSPPRSYVEWPAIFAGAFATASTSLVLLAFGSAIGLTAVSPWSADSTSLRALGVGAALWFLLIVIWSFALGGYLAGRLRHRLEQTTPSEMRFRDGSHGLLVWALTIVFAVILGAAGLSSLGGGLIEATKDRQSAFNPTSIASDRLLRPGRPNQTISSDVRNDVSHILARSAKRGEVESGDRNYLASIVAANSGVSQPDAEKRIDDAIATMKDSLERARKVGIILGFLTGAILLVGAAVAWWTGTVGGSHREDGNVWWGLG